MPEKPHNRHRAARQSPPTPHHIADEPVGEVASGDPALQSPTTDSGLPVAEQIRKEWDPKKKGGLPTFLGNRSPNVAR